jgi:putative DNA primase/helicase
MGGPRAPLPGRNGGERRAHCGFAPNSTNTAARHSHRRFDFAAINRAALARLPELCRQWLPGGRLIGREWTCGSLAGEPGASCKVNIATGRWSDFATGERGGDPVSFAAAIWKVPQTEAARRLAELLGMEACRHG